MKRRTLLISAASAVLLAALAVTGAVAIGNQSTDAAPTPTASATTAPENGFGAGALQDPQAREERAEDPPVRIDIPAIGVSSSLETLALMETGELASPVDYGLAGWYAQGTAPGEIGPAIIAGHVDWAYGPAVFGTLADLKAGDEIAVTLASGAVETFVMYDSEQSAQATFPTSSVYGNVPTPELRIITCSGNFDRGSGNYSDNLIVYARQV